MKPLEIEIKGNLVLIIFRNKDFLKDFIKAYLDFNYDFIEKNNLEKLDYLSKEVSKEYFLRYNTLENFKKLKIFYKGLKIEINELREILFNLDNLEKLEDKENFYFIKELNFNLENRKSYLIKDYTFLIDFINLLEFLEANYLEFYNDIEEIKEKYKEELKEIKKKTNLINSFIEDNLEIILKKYLVDF